MTKTIYLCGPINGCTDAEANDWRTLVKTLWSGATLDPMRRDYRGREHECRDEIVELDKIDVMNADALLVSCDKPSWGTAMEVVYAWERAKPVVVVCPEDMTISPWLSYHSHRIVHSYEDGVAACRELLS